MYLYSKNRKISRLFLSAIALGMAILTRLTSILVVPPLFIMIIVYYLKHYTFEKTVKLVLKDVLLFSLAFLPFVGLIFWYNHYRFGSILETGYSLMAVRTGVRYFTTKSILTGLEGFLISPGKGLFFYSPIAILFFFSIKLFLKKNFCLGVSFILVIISYLMFLSNYIFWHGDWAWGPRYILVITPFLIIPIAEILDSTIWLKKRVLRGSVYFIFIISFIIQLSAICVDFNKYFFTLRAADKVKFTEIWADRVQPIIVPPMELYFDWHRSPIFAQFGFIYDIGKGIKNYKYIKLPDNATLEDTVKVEPNLNIFDFWWLYKYFIENSYSGFIAALILLSLSMYYGSKLWKLSGL